MADGRRKCAKCRFTIAFICGACETLIEKKCLDCHRNRKHQGRWFDLAVYCPHCGELTKAPRPEQWAVFVRSEVFRLAPEAVANGLKISTDSVRAISSYIPHLCDSCQGRLFPPTDELKIILFLDGAFTIEEYRMLVEPEKYRQMKDDEALTGQHFFKPTIDQTARYFEISKYKLRKIIKDILPIYEKAIWQIHHQGTLRRYLGEAVPAIPRHPIEGYAWKRGE